MKKNTLRKYGAAPNPPNLRPFPGHLPPVPLQTDTPEVRQQKWLARLKIQVARSLDRWSKAKEKYGPSDNRTLAAQRRNSRVARQYSAMRQVEFEMFTPGQPR